MGAPDTISTDLRSFAWFEIPAEQLLAPVCPHCGAPGTVGFAVQGNSSAVLIAHRCDLCAGHAARQDTLRFAWLVAASLFGIAAASAVTFIWGERGRTAQVLGLILGLGILGRIAMVSSKGTARLLETFEGPNAHTRWLKSRSPWINGALRQMGWNETGAPTGHADGFSWQSALWGLPALVALSWWLGLHSLAQASIHVVNMGPGPVTVLIDDRRTATIPATRFEQPGVGYHGTSIAGERSFRLLTSSGDVVYEGSWRLLPGQTLLITRLLPGTCVLQEQRDYSAPGGASRWSLLSTASQALVVDTPVDSWFTPLSNSPKGSAPMDAPGSAGTGTKLRTAVRLLPCPADRGTPN